MSRPGCRVACLNCANCTPKNTFSPTAGIAIGVEKCYGDAVAILASYHLGCLELDN